MIVTLKKLLLDILSKMHVMDIDKTYLIAYYQMLNYKNIILST